ncbi:hypothetical protein PoMZ_06671 [Pyricularia oryzae]|uniref:Lysine-specific metallo-endopeptidase domain-containing protein n=1 Tax=Pyricularia oryzae TaxID=318829 RepID=A0A4P7NRL6_PYROR|nr:hypothetical protein PoMZ_06671 [Pyricularia oryzae]
MLCYRCQRFSLHKLTRLRQQTGTYPLTHAHQGAKAGCSFCSLLEQPVDKSQQHYESERRMRIYLECQIDLSQNSYGERLSLPAGQSSRRDEFSLEARQPFDGQAPARASLVDVIMSISHGYFSTIGGKNYILTDKVRLSEHNLTTVELNHCMELAQLAYYAAGYQGERGAKRREYFGTDNPADIAVIQQVYANVYEACNPTKRKTIEIHCEDLANRCTNKKGKALGYCYSHKYEEKVVLCPLFFKRPVRDDGAGKTRWQMQDVLLLHEMTHLASIKLTADYGIVDHEDLRKLSRKQKLNHANTYAYFAHCVRAGC